MKISYVPTFTDTDFPLTAAVADKVVVEIFDGTNTLSQSLDTAPYDFAGVADGSYTLRASMLDVNGAVMGTPYTEAFTVLNVVVPGGTVTVALPTGGTITQTAE